MSDSVIVWDIETILDVQRFAAANDLSGKSDEEIRAAHGEKFPKHIFHSIVCIGALVAERATHGSWHVKASGAPHIGERSEKELIESFVSKIAELEPQLVTFNGASFDLPVLRYRAMVHKVSAPGLTTRNYFYRYTDDAMDLCDVLASFSSQARATLHEICRAMGLPGKGSGVDGSSVASLFAQGRLRDISDYCEGDVINTYQLWLRYELFRGRLTVDQFAASEADLDNYVRERAGAKPHLAVFLVPAACSVDKKPPSGG
jgi:predicted PolB exonuclease-like 3'-5' exonuclease